MTPALWFERAVTLFPARPAILEGTRVILTYGAWGNRVRRLAQGMVAHGIRPGDRVAVFMPNTPDYLTVLYATWTAGAVAVPINAKLHPAEAAWMLEHSGAAMVFSKAGDLTDLAPDGCTVVIAPEGIETILADQPIPACIPRKPGDLAWLFYTSGTTGRPKGAMLTNANLQAMMLSYMTDVDQVSGEDAALYAAPMSHGAGLYNFMHVLRGARHVIPESGAFEPAEIEELARKLGNLHLFAAPTMVRRMVGHARASGWDGSGLKTVVYGGGPMYVADIIEAVDVLGPHFAQIYGQGECPMAITAMTRQEVAERDQPGWKERLGSVGRAQSAVALRVVGDDGTDMPHGGVGEIIVQGPPVMAGYWQNPEASAETLVDGWLRTGDKGALSADGTLTLHDRSKDVIISGGSNIYPREVEEALLTHPDVQQVSVVGQPDAEWGEIVVAFVVGSDALRAEDLDAHVATQIARFKRPKLYRFLDDLPKNAYGKVLKTELRALLTGP